jgi:hypothetical protein
MEEKIQPYGQVTITLRDAKTGSIIETRTANTITTPGKYHVLDRIYGRTSVSGLAPTQSGCMCAVGAGSATNTAWDTTLTSEISGNFPTVGIGRKYPTSVTRTNQTVSISTLFGTDEANGTVTECGLFTRGYDSGGNLLTVDTAAKNGGLLFSKAVFGGITKDTAATMTMDWEVTL